jgi:hypothetical protein
MRFTSVGRFGASSNHTPQIFIDMSWWDGTPLQNDIVASPRITTPDKNDIDKRDILKFNWVNITRFKGQQVYYSDAESKYYIDEPDIPPTDEQLIDIMNSSYRYLKETFKGRREEHFILPVIEDMSPDTIRRTLSLLRELFPN